MTTNEISAPLFEGEVALVSPVLPDALRIVSQGRQTRLFCTAPGSYPVKLDLIAKITKAEPWNQISFVGPPAAIASVTATASAPGVEMQLLSGTQLDPEKKATSQGERLPGVRPDAGDALAEQGGRGDAQVAGHGGYGGQRADHPDRDQVHHRPALRDSPGRRAAPDRRAARQPRAHPDPGRANPRLAGQAGRRAPGAHHRVHQAGRESLQPSRCSRSRPSRPPRSPPRSSRPSRSKWSASPAPSR